MGELSEQITPLFNNVRSVIIGKDEQIKNVLCCWIAGGHVLLEDVPGTGKTILARAIAKSAAVDFKRVQFTPDLLPSDIVGSALFNQKKGAFEFLKGPLFSTVFLADEINRATPRTQSALLESMAENQITAEGTTWQLNPLFFVIATQNPIEQHGTFPLPEAQLDRFMMKISLGYPTPEEEIKVIKNQNRQHPIHSLHHVENEERLKLLREKVTEIKVSDPIYQYTMQIITQLRENSEVRLGPSPRATIALIRAAQAKSLINGTPFVRPATIYQMAKPVLAHRLVLAPEARLAKRSAGDVIDQVLQSVTVPLGT